MGSKGNGEFPLRDYKGTMGSLILNKGSDFDASPITTGLGANGMKPGGKSGPIKGFGN